MPEGEPGGQGSSGGLQRLGLGAAQGAGQRATRSTNSQPRLMKKRREKQHLKSHLRQVRSWREATLLRAGASGRKRAFGPPPGVGPGGMAHRTQRPGERSGSCAGVPAGSVVSRGDTAGRGRAVCRRAWTSPNRNAHDEPQPVFTKLNALLRGTARTTAAPWATVGCLLGPSPSNTCARYPGNRGSRQAG